MLHSAYELISSLSLNSQLGLLSDTCWSTGICFEGGGGGIIWRAGNFVLQGYQKRGQLVDLHLLPFLVPRLRHLNVVADGRG